MKTVIIYKSKHGSTKEYAEYIKKNIPNSDLFPYEEFNSENLPNYDNVILGSSVYIGSTFHRDFLIKNWSILKEKKVFIFAVGLLPEDHPQSVTTYKQIPNEIREKIKYIKLPGRIVLSKLNVFEKILTKMISGNNHIPENFIDLKMADSVIMYFNTKE